MKKNICIWVLVAGFVYFSSACVSAQEGRKPVKLIDNAPISKNKPIKNLAQETSTIPKLAQITEGLTTIDFLKRVVLTEKKSTPLAGSRSLGNMHGQSVMYVNTPNTNNVSGADKKADYIITYNHRRDLLGKFTGVINVVVKDASYLKTITDVYPVKKLLVFGKNASLQLLDVYGVSSVYQRMRVDSNIEFLKLKLNEDTVVPH